MSVGEAVADTVHGAGLLTTDELRVGTGLTYRQIDYWTRRGWLAAVHVGPEGASERGGSGRPRGYPREERVAAQHAARLLRAGFRAENALALAHAGIGRHRLADGIVLILGSGV